MNIDLINGEPQGLPDMTRVYDPTSVDFEKATQMIDRFLCEKYAFVARDRVAVLRRNPLGDVRLDDNSFNRFSRTQYSLQHRMAPQGSVKRWFRTLGQLVELPDAVVVERMDFLPGRPEVTHDDAMAKTLNLWKASSFPETTEEPTVFLEHVNYLFDGEESAVEHVLRWLAHLVRHPGERCSHALLITSEAKGIGKSTLGSVVRALIGETNARVAQSKDLKSQYDNWIVGRSFVVVDEVYERGNHTLVDKLKPLITEPVIGVNLKYGPSTEVRNFARIMLFSNNDAPLDIEDGDRRFWVHSSKAQPKHPDYYKRLHDYVSSPQGLAAIHWHLMRLDLGDFNPFAPPPSTEAKRSIQSTSGNPLITYVHDAVYSGHFLEALGSSFSFDAVQRVLSRDGWSSFVKNDRELAKALEDAGCVQRRKLVGGSKVRLWWLPEVALRDREAAEADVQF